jgi:hypothetical protein
VTLVPQGLSPPCIFKRTLSQQPLPPFRVGAARNSYQDSPGAVLPQTQSVWPFPVSSAVVGQRRLDNICTKTCEREFVRRKITL